MAEGKILVVEDDKSISKLVSYNLERAGFKTTVAESGEEGLKILSKSPADLIILDIMLPGIDGLEVCKLIKQKEEFSHIPVVLLTAKGEEVDRVVGFEIGAEDYIVKPFSPRELVLRIKAILKRLNPPRQAGELIKAGKLLIDLPRHRVTVDKKEVVLTPMEFNLLITLVQRKGRVQSREKLLDDVWDIASDVTTRTVDTHIKRLREKLGKIGDSIETIRGIGYRFREKE